MTDDVSAGRPSAGFGLEPAQLQALLAEGLHGVDDGELFLEYRETESLTLDDGRLKGAAFDTSKGFGLRVLSEPTSSPTLLALKAEFMQRFPAAKWTTYAAASGDGGRAGSVLAFGRAHRAILKTEAARVILTLDADLFAPTFPGNLAHARNVANGRKPGDDMSRIYSVECAYSLVGSYAGLIVELDVAAAKPDPRLLTNGPVQDVARWVFWQGHPPLIW